MRTAILPFLTTTFLITAGCGGRQLAPAPQADRIAGMSSAAQAQQNGVTMVLQSDHWEGTPSNLSVAVTPAHVQIQNGSTAPLQIAYRRFHLETDSGFKSAAMPPFKIEGSVAQTAVSPLVSPAYAWNDFYVAPYYASFYGPGRAPWAGPWAYDGAWYSGYTGWRQPLPTEDMLRRALPEGVLAAGGQVSGFIYFQRVPDEAERVTFTARLINADTEDKVASLSIPFVVVD